MLGIIPAAGIGSRIQPLAFSKELLPVGSRLDGTEERPCAVSEYLLERMVLAGADKICIVISPGKSDIMEYYGQAYGSAAIFYAVQPEPLGLCDAIFCASLLCGDDEPVLVGLPDTVWFPQTGFAELPAERFSFLLFPVDHPEYFNSVVLDPDDRVTAIVVKSANAPSHWIWGAFKMQGRTLRHLRSLWQMRGGQDQYIGTLVNAYLAEGGEVIGVRAGESYVDVGTLHGYRAAIRLLSSENDGDHIPDGLRVAGWPSGRPHLRSS